MMMRLFFLLIVCHCLVDAQLSVTDALEMDLVQQCTGTVANYTGSFCFEDDGTPIVNYTYCDCYPLPASSGLLNTWIPTCGTNIIVSMQYNRLLSMDIGLVKSVKGDGCRSSLRRYVCYEVFKQHFPSTPPMNYVATCRSACSDVKNKCQISEECNSHPISGCTGSQV
ncbi:hypothetical protein PROFUN_05837 [Planoprotostelium fungivorum]|uniref:FZ domain-containing protein n=1 Tax=Planoprotostelium fungivorum TaxID=1890364 RepID=A0A2P6NKR4_9EUKA|nr:hypothetical protein PROFUN_05837 [Planoprotostelium fungivorum]